MDKQILNDYIDACELIKETEDDIRRIKRWRKTIVTDSVKGSMPDFPYAAQNFKIQGVSHSVLEDMGNLDAEEQLLEERKANAQKVKLQVDAWLNTIPQRMQRIIRYKIFKRQSWGKVAQFLGRDATADGIRMEFNNFMGSDK